MRSPSYDFIEVTTLAVVLPQVWTPVVVDGGFYFLRPCRYFSHLLEGCSNPGMTVKMMIITDHVVMLG